MPCLLLLAPTLTAHVLARGPPEGVGTDCMCVLWLLLQVNAMQLLSQCSMLSTARLDSIIQDGP
jgi:hypothetical protein